MGDLGHEYLALFWPLDAIQFSQPLAVRGHVGDTVKVAEVMKTTLAGRFAASMDDSSHNVIFLGRMHAQAAP